MGETLRALLSWDDAGPVAILVLVVAMLAWLSRWLLRQLIHDKDSQIARANSLNDKLVDEVGETLDQILNALRDVARKETKS